MWEMKSPDRTIPAESFSANFQGWITPPASGVYTLRLTVGGWCAIFPEGCYGAPTIVADDSREGERTVTATIRLQKDEPYFFCVNYSKNRECDASVRLEWKLPESPESAGELARLDAAAKEADAVIFVRRAGPQPRHRGPRPHDDGVSAGSGTPDRAPCRGQSPHGGGTDQRLADGTGRLDRQGSGHRRSVVSRHGGRHGRRRNPLRAKPIPLAVCRSHGQKNSKTRRHTGWPRRTSTP